MDRSLPDYDLLLLLAEFVDRSLVGHITLSLNGRLSLRRFELLWGKKQFEALTGLRWYSQ